MISIRSFLDFFKSSSCSAKYFNLSSSDENSSRASGLIFPRSAKDLSAAANRFSCCSLTNGTKSPCSSSPASFSINVGTSLSGPNSAIRVSESTPNSSMARTSSCSIRKRCSARAISSRWTLEVSCSISSARSLICARIAKISPSREVRESSKRARS